MDASAVPDRYIVSDRAGISARKKLELRRRLQAAISQARSL
jgi:hypothetical protein